MIPISPKPFQAHRKHGYHYLLLLCLLFATGLRFHRLTAQSFWNDEGNTARLVERSIPLILEGAAGDIHPPGYYLLLHTWRAFGGESEFALRGFSALCGVLTVAIVAAIAHRVGGRRTAIGASIFLTIHPLAVYYSQEARMYALLGLVSTLSLWAAIRLIAHAVPTTSPEPSRTPKIVPGLRNDLLNLTLLGFSLTLGLYTQYTYSLVIVGLNLAFGCYWLVNTPWLNRNQGNWQWRTLGLWIGAHLLGGLLFLPWAPIALGAMGWRPPDLGSQRALHALTRTALVGITLPEGTSPYVLAVGGALLFLAMLKRPHDRFATWASAGVAFVPPLLIAALGVYRPAYLKFLTASVPALGVMLALSLGAPAANTKTPHRFWWVRTNGLAILGTVLLLALIPAQLKALQRLYTDPTYARDDYRGIAARITSEGQPGGAILLSAPNQWEVFTYYYQGPLPVIPAPYRPTREAATSWVNEIIEQYTHFYVLFWGDSESDPKRYIEPLLAQKAYKASDEWINSVRLVHYGTSERSQHPATHTSAQLGDMIMLAGFTHPEHPIKPGSVFPITLFWHVTRPPGERLKVFIHLSDADGNLVAQVDGEPVGGFSLTDRWQVGEHITDRHGLLIPKTLAPGDYNLRVGMYRLSGERLTITQRAESIGDTLLLGSVTIGQ